MRVWNNELIDTPEKAGQAAQRFMEQHSGQHELIYVADRRNIITRWLDRWRINRRIRSLRDLRRIP